MNGEIGVDFSKMAQGIPFEAFISDASDVTLGDVRKSIDKETIRFKKVCIEWDDVVQDTTFGAALLMRPEILDDKELEEKYMSRLEISPIDFFEKEYNIPKKEMYAYLKENYELILKVSPLSRLMGDMFKWAPAWESLHIFFRHKFEHMALLNDFIETMYNKVSITFHFEPMTPENMKDPTVIITRSIAPYYQHYTVEKKTQEMVYITSLMDSGFTEEFLAAYFHTAKISPTKRPLGPYFCEIFFYMEEFYADRPLRHQ